MMALPTVTPADLHIVQLSPKLRRILHHRAQAAAAREYAPVLAADRAEAGATKREYRREVGADRGASQMVENALGHALAGLGGSGLTDGYLKQAENEISSRAGDTASALPFLIADAKEERNKGLREARSQYRTDQASMLQGAASAFDQLLKEARGQGSSQLKEEEGRERQQRKESREREEGRRQEHTFDPGAIQNAKLALTDALSEWAKNPVEKIKLPDGSTEEKHLKEINPLKTHEDWLKFAHGLEKGYGGFGLAEINKVIQEYLTGRKQHEHEGRVPQPGVPAGPRNGG